MKIESLVPINPSISFSSCSDAIFWEDALFSLVKYRTMRCFHSCTVSGGLPETKCCCCFVAIVLLRSERTEKKLGIISKNISVAPHTVAQHICKKVRIPDRSEPLPLKIESKYIA